MVTKYDVFEYVYSKGSVLKPQEIALAFRSTSINYHAIYNMLLALKKLKVILRKENGFEAVKSEKSDLLYRIIKFCLQNDINYNEILDGNLASFVSETFLRKRISVRDVKIDQRTYSKYVKVLEKNGMLIILSRKPLTVAIPYNSFLRDLIAYFGETALVAKPKEDEYVNEIEKELFLFRRLRRNNEARYRRIANDYQIRFIHHSLSIEGNPVTLPDTIKLLKEQIVPSEYSTESIQEVQNYQRAMSQMSIDTEGNKLLTKESILNYHRMAMQQRQEMAGKFRLQPVRIRGNPDYDTAETENIEPRLDILIKKYNQFVAKKKNSLKEILEFAAYFHNEFQHIHPSEDGNSRTTRLITFHLLKTQNIPILDIPLGLLELYILATKGAKKRIDNDLNQILQQIILYNLKTINKRLQE